MNKERSLRKEIFGQLKGVTSLFLVGFVLGQGFDFQMKTSIDFIKILVLSLGIGILTIALANLITRAILFGFLSTTVGAISSIIIFFYMYSYLISSSSQKPIFNIGIHACLVLLTCIVSTLTERENLERAQKSNEESGKLNLRRGIWDIEKPIIWDTPEREKARESKYLLAKRLSILFPGIGYIIARILDPSPIGLSTFTVLFFAYLSAYGSGRKINLVAQLYRWEKEIGKSIQLSQ